jgi:hypothetical protein
MPQIHLQEKIPIRSKYPSQRVVGIPMIAKAANTAKGDMWQSWQPWQPSIPDVVDLRKNLDDYEVSMRISDVSPYRR